MFIVKNMVDPIGTEYYVLNDIEEVGDVVIGITGDEKDGKKAMLVASEMRFGGLYTDKRWRLECVRDLHDKTRI